METAKTKNQDLPAFASVAISVDGSGYQQDGLTKREYCVIQAMQGLLSNPEWMKEYKNEKYLMQSDVSDIVAEVAIKTADTILAKLSTKQ
jgi:hypothetical protein